MNKFKLPFVLLISVFLTACGQNIVSVDKVKKIKNVAVVMYTVPPSIVYKDDVRDNSYADFADDLIGRNGKNAANISVKTFAETLQKQALPFKVMLHQDVISNADFIALYKPTVVVKKKKDDSIMGQALSFLTTTAKPDLSGVGPEKMNEYGLVPAWQGNTALTGKPGELEYIKAAIEALKVDAVLVVNDVGYSFSCEACIGIGTTMNGAASTGSAFNATLVGRSGAIMNIREWFATTDEQGIMALGIVDPTEHDVLFEEHGRRMAEVFAVEVNKEISGK